MRSTSSPTSLTLVLGLTLLSTLSAVAASTNTTLSVTAAGSPVTSITSGTVVTLTATVLAGSTPVTPGRVNFCDATATSCTDVHILGSAQLTRSGAATFRFVPGVGDHSYKAVFVGTHTHVASTSPASSLEVSGIIPSTIQIAHSGGASDYTLTATVGGVGSVAPGGTVAFQDASTGTPLLGTATLGAGAVGLTFSTSSKPATGSFPVSVISGDFNGDGKQDLVIPDCPRIYTYLGNGDGTFTQGQLPEIDNCAGDSLVADFNSDGKADLAMIGNGVTILLGKGDGNFEGQMHFPTGIGAEQIVTADFNADGIPDLATINWIDNTVSVLLGKGNGTFSTGPTTAVPNASTFGTADFNGDGIPDLVTVDFDSDKLIIRLGNGDGTFATIPASAGVVGYDGSFAIADFNGDGKADFVDASGILLGNGDGTFTPAPSSLQPGAGRLLPGDFNGDGFVDLAVAVYDYVSETQVLTVLLGDGNGKFSKKVVAPFGLGIPGPLVAADFNGDGGTDLAILDTGGGLDVQTLLSASRSATASISHFVVPVASSGELVQASYAGNDGYTPQTSLATSLEAFTAELSPDNLVFAPTHVGDSSGYQKVTYTNTGTGTLKLTVGEPSYGFQVREQTCGSTLAPGADCTFSIVFKPGVYGDYDNETMWVTSNAIYSQGEILLSGVGLGADLESYPTKLVFNSTAVGEVAGYKKIVLKNFGNVPMAIRSIAITNATDFYSWGIREQTCGSTLQPNERCSFSIAFRPSRIGESTADVTVDDMLGSWQKKIPLTGTGKQ